MYNTTTTTKTSNTTAKNTDNKHKIRSIRKATVAGFLKLLTRVCFYPQWVWSQRLQAIKVVFLYCYWLSDEVVKEHLLQVHQERQQRRGKDECRIDLHHELLRTCIIHTVRLYIYIYESRCALAWWNTTVPQCRPLKTVKQ